VPSCFRRPARRRGGWWCADAARRPTTYSPVPHSGAGARRGRVRSIPPSVAAASASAPAQHAAGLNSKSAQPWNPSSGPHQLAHVSGFQAARLGLVHRQIGLRGGARLWARDYGLPREPLPNRLGAWSDDRIRRELTQFLAGRSDWPTKYEFDAAGKVTLRRVLDGFGGQERWASELGVRIPRQRRRLHSWTDEQIEAELRRFTAGTRRRPTKREFEEAGLRSLYNAIMGRDARKPLAKKLGLRVLPRYARLPMRWSDEAIDRGLSDGLQGRDTWPTWTEFVAADLNRLYRAISRSPGGHEAWADRYGLPPLNRRPACAARVAHRNDGPTLGSPNSPADTAP
jgi:hypothetical protein